MIQGKSAQLTDIGTHVLSDNHFPDAAHRCQDTQTHYKRYANLSLEIHLEIANSEHWDSYDGEVHNNTQC